MPSRSRKLVFTLALTLTLSPKEREQRLAASCCSKVAGLFPDTRHRVKRRTILPLLGERAGVRAVVPPITSKRLISFRVFIFQARTTAPRPRRARTGRRRSGDCRSGQGAVRGPSNPFRRALRLV